MSEIVGRSQDGLSRALAGIAAIPLEIAMERNCHANCDGSPWGWFEQAGKTIGHWSREYGSDCIKPAKGVSGLRLLAMADLFERKYGTAPRISEATDG